MREKKKTGRWMKERKVIKMNERKDEGENEWKKGNMWKIMRWKWIRERKNEWKKGNI